MTRFIPLDRRDPAWKEAARRGLGASDAAALVGLNPYDSLPALYARKKGLLDTGPTPAMRVGLAVEPLVEQLWREATGKRCRQVRGLFVDGEKDYFRAHVHRKVVGENAGLSLKMAGPFAKLDLKGPRPPALYLCQCQWIMMVCGFDRMYLALLSLNGYRLRCWELAPDRLMIQALRRAGEDFWNRHILLDQTPSPDGSPASALALEALSPPPAPGGVSLEQQAQIIRRYVDLGGQVEALRKEREALAQQLRLALDGHPQGQGGGYQVSWVSQRRETLDAAALRDALPQVYRQFLREKTVNALRVTRENQTAPQEIDGASQENRPKSNLSFGGEGEGADRQAGPAKSNKKNRPKPEQAPAREGKDAAPHPAPADCPEPAQASPAKSPGKAGPKSKSQAGRGGKRPKNKPKSGLTPWGEAGHVD